MNFLFALLALGLVYACWHYFWSTPNFAPYLVTILGPQYGPRAKLVLYIAVVFAFWGLIINEFMPSALSILISIITACLWLQSPDGEAFLKSKT